jgi:hypothetical protein
MVKMHMRKEMKRLKIESKAELETRMSEIKPVFKRNKYKFWKKRELKQSEIKEALVATQKEIDELGEKFKTEFIGVAIVVVET